MKFIYYLVFFFWYLLSLLPLRVLYFISDMLFVPLFYGLKYRRDIVHRNIAGSFPEKSEKEILKIEKEFYHFFCDYVVETIKLFSMSKKQMMKRMTFSGLDEVRETLGRENKKCCFLYLGHYCNWEYVASLQYWFQRYIADRFIILCIIKLSISCFSDFADSLVVSLFR